MATASAAPTAGTQENGGQAHRTGTESAVVEPPLTRRRLRRLAADTTPAPAESAAAPFTAPLQIVEQAAAAPSDDEAAQSVQDEFLLAAKALNFTGPSAIPQVTAQAAPAGRGAVPPETGHVAPRRGRGSAFRRLVTATASIGAMGAIGLLAVGMTTPMGAVAQGDVAASIATVSAGAQSEKIEDDEIQAFVASSEVHNADVERSQGYETQTFADIASASGVSTNGAFFTNDPHADIQWPFIVGTSMSSGFGPRWGRMHEGVDFTPGDGAPIQVVADGVVRTATEAGGAYGVNVYVDHVIDGKVVTTHYAHMQYGSLKVVDGQKVEVGDTLGLVGNTGRSYGAHLHFEVIVNGSAIDPLPWLEENANTRYSDDEAAEAEEALTELLGAPTASE
jgi:murein DD-endopeptidase MepM/ murein hydrolase activator NlpD